MANAKGPKDKAGAARINVAEQPLSQVSREQWEKMIAEAAYFRALARGFQGGDPLDDWLAAEAELSRLLPTRKQ